MRRRCRWDLVLAFGCIAFTGSAGATPPENEHPAGCSMWAGAVSAASLVRPIALKSGIGRLHQRVTTKSVEAEAFYDQGIAYLASYEWVDAARSFREALRRDPQLAMAHLGLAKALEGVEANEEARAELALAATLTTGDNACTEIEQTWIVLGKQQLDAIEARPGERAAAHEAYKRAIEALIARDPDDPHAWVLRGNAAEAGAWGRGQTGGVEAIAFYESALERDPDHLGAHHFLAHSFENIGQYENAAEHARIYAAAAPAVAHAQHMYGHVLPRLGRWEEALAQFAAADRIERQRFADDGSAPEDDWHHGHNLQLMGVVLARLGRDAEAERFLLEAYHLQQRGRFAGIYGGPYVEYLLLRGRNGEALAAATALEQRGPALARMVGAALDGEASLAMNRPADAESSLSRAKVAAEAARVDLEGTPYELTVVHFERPYVLTLEGLLALHRGDQKQASETLVPLADEVAGSPRLDGWANGVLRLARLVRAAEASNSPDLAQELRQRLSRVDALPAGPQATPGRAASPSGPARTR